MKASPDAADFLAGVWDRLTVPIRPSAEGLNVYQRELDRLSNPGVLILGATPELIDMAVDRGADTVVSIERFPAVTEAMRRLGTHDWTSVRCVIGDWLVDRPEFHSGFSYIACDGGPLFLRFPDEWERLFKLARRNLEQGGVLVVKSWAEPAGQRDYDNMVSTRIDSFKARHAAESLTRTRKAYRRLASELRVIGRVGATKDDGSFDQRVLLARIDKLMAELERQFPDPEMVSVTHAAFRHLARSRPGTTDTISGVGFEGAEQLLNRQGFVACEHVALSDPPLPGANYMFVAR